MRILPRRHRERRDALRRVLLGTSRGRRGRRYNSSGEDTAAAIVGIWMQMQNNDHCQLSRPAVVVGWSRPALRRVFQDYRITAFFMPKALDKLNELDSCQRNWYLFFSNVPVIAQQQIILKYDCYHLSLSYLPLVSAVL